MQKYCGIDVVPELLKENQQRYGSNSIAFQFLDAGTSPLPEGDLLICKDLLMHLTEAEALHIVREGLMKFKFCIFVNDLSIQASSDRDTSTYRFRPVDLTSAPYNVLPLYTTLYHLPELSITKQLIIVSATKNKSLNEYLKEHGFNLSPLNSETNEGYSSDAQREVFAEELKKIQPKRILEIGFNAGHSCEVFLESNQETSITVFDINMHSYTHFGVEFMKRKYLNRFQFVQGDSLKTVPFYAMNHSEKFDLIFIDGCHSFDYAVKDIYHCKRLAHSKSVLWIDDYAPYGVQGAVDYCVSRGLIELIEIKSVHDWAGVRSWVKAKYKK